MAEDEDKGLLGKATDEIGKAAAKHAAKAAFDEAGRRAKQAFEGVVGSAEAWVGREAASAEERREASGLPDTDAGPHWTDRLAEEGEQAFQRARTDTVVDNEAEAEAEAEAEEQARAARKARAREELMRMKAALSGHSDPLLAEAERGRTAVPLPPSEPEPVVDSLEAELEAMAAAVAADAGSIVPSDEQAPTDEQPPTDEDDPVMAALARARAAREAALDEAFDEPMDPPGGHAAAAPVEDPAMAALAAARAARRAAGDEVEESVLDQPDGGDAMSAAERVLAKARAARGAASFAASAQTDRVRAEARARAEAIAEDALQSHERITSLPELPQSDTASADPLSSAEEALRRARAARIGAGTEDPMEAARAAARARIQRLTEAAAAEAAATSAASPLVGLDPDADPMARARAALDKAAGSRGASPADQASKLARARELLRSGGHRKSPEELAREVLDGYEAPDADALAADALAESARLAERQQAIAEKARREAEAWGEAMRRRAEQAQAEVQARIAGRTAYETSAGTPEERTRAALEASAAARAKASGRDPQNEAERRVELERLKKAQASRAEPAGPVRKRDLLGKDSPTLVPDASAPAPSEPDTDEADASGPAEDDDLPPRKL